MALDFSRTLYFSFAIKVLRFSNHKTMMEYIHGYGILDSVLWEEGTLI